MAGRKQSASVEPIRTDVDVYRQRIADLVLELDTASNAPAPESEVRGRVEQIVLRAEAEARRAWNPAAIMSASDDNLGVAFRADTLGACVLIHGAKHMADFLVREAIAATEMNDAKPMSAAEKAAEIERIEDAIFDAEVAEERLIRTALADYGAVIARRSSIRNPVVIVATDAGLGEHS